MGEYPNSHNLMLWQAGRQGPKGGGQHQQRMHNKRPMTRDLSNRRPPQANRVNISPYVWLRIADIYFKAMRYFHVWLSKYKALVCNAL
jgi:hypothetical protein